MRKSRKYLVVTLSAMFALATAAVALAVPKEEVKQTLSAKVSKSKKLDKSDFKSIKLSIKVSGCFKTPGTDECDPNRRPSGPEAERVLFKFDKKDIAFNTGEAKKCKASKDQIGEMDPDQAKAACGNKSVIGKGSAVATVGQRDLDAEVTAFNAKGDHIWLHSWVTQLQAGSVIDAKLKSGNKLDVHVDPLAGGAARLKSFEVAIKKDAYIQARCTDKRIKTKSNWFYRDVEDDPLSVSYTQKCK